MKQLRDWINSGRGTMVAIVVGIGLVGVAGYSIWSALGSTDAELLANERMFIDAENGKTFRYKLELDKPIPAKSPHSGKNTGYPAEACYWTADGKPKKEPTWVLLNRFKNDPSPTYCPDCGRLVVELNPGAMDGQKAPPKKGESRQGGREVER